MMGSNSSTGVYFDFKPGTNVAATKWWEDNTPAPITLGQLNNVLDDIAANSSITYPIKSYKPMTSEDLDKQIHITVVDDLNKEPLPKAKPGKIKILSSELVPKGETWVLSEEYLDKFEWFKTVESSCEEEGAPVKIEPLANGFMFQAGEAQAGEDPFYLEIHLIGEDQFAISANKNGIISRSDVKALRRSLKSLINTDKELYYDEEGVDFG